MTGYTIVLPLWDDRDDILRVNFAIWPGEHSGQADTLEIIHATVNRGLIPSLETIKELVWAWIKAEREAV